MLPTFCQLWEHFISKMGEYFIRRFVILFIRFHPDSKADHIRFIRKYFSNFFASCLLYQNIYKRASICSALWFVYHPIQFLLVLLLLESVMFAFLRAMIHNAVTWVSACLLSNSNVCFSYFFAEATSTEVFAITFLIIYLPIISNCFSGFPFFGLSIFYRSIVSSNFVIGSIFKRSLRIVWLFPLLVPDFWLPHPLEFCKRSKDLYFLYQIALILFSDADRVKFVLTNRSL